MKENFETEDLFQIDVSGDQSTVWINSIDGTCVGRFSKKFGIDVHNTWEKQMETGQQCLHCTHGPTTEADWKVFQEQMKLNFNVDVPNDLISWDVNPSIDRVRPKR